MCIRDRANRGQSSTGRRIPLNLKESLAMEQAMSNPLDGTVLPINMSDIRWPSSEGWIKMQQIFVFYDGTESVSYTHLINLIMLLENIKVMLIVLKEVWIMLLD